MKTAATDEYTKLLIKCEEPGGNPHPHCSHGPTLLFYRIDKNASITGYYGCSAHRDKKSCSIHLSTNMISEKILKRRYPVDTNKFKLNRRLFSQGESKNRNYCHTCQIPFVTVFGHKGHDIVNNISNDMIASPTSFLRPLENDKIQAQYIFHENSLKFFKNSLLELNVSKVICIGAPRMHEYIRQNCHKVKSFLLDYDHRFHFFYDCKEYSWYNMCNNHFFDSESQIEFQRFLKLRENENILIFTDPPFGCRTEPIAHTIRQLFQLFAHINACVYRPLAVFWIFPYFSENYIHDVMPEMEMSDYKVNYVNHTKYHAGDKGRKLGSPVRLFTNVPLNLISLPSEEGYKYCHKCERWTAVENLHCDICKNCPSKNGATFRHCHQCGICVKPNYVHCIECRRCTQKSQHKCSEYQKTLRCWICRKVGHNEKRCSFLSKLFGRSRAKMKSEWKVISCLLCHRRGHNEKNCPKRDQYLKEEYFMSKTEITSTK